MVTAKDVHGKTALTYAAESEVVEIVRVVSASMARYSSAAQVRLSSTMQDVRAYLRVCTGYGRLIHSSTKAKNKVVSPAYRRRAVRFPPASGCIEIDARLVSLWMLSRSVSNYAETMQIYAVGIARLKRVRSRRFCHRVVHFPHARGNMRGPAGFVGFSSQRFSLVSLLGRFHFRLGLCFVECF